MLEAAGKYICFLQTLAEKMPTERSCAWSYC